MLFRNVHLSLSIHELCPFIKFRSVAVTCKFMVFLKCPFKKMGYLKVSLFIVCAECRLFLNTEQYWHSHVHGVEGGPSGSCGCRWEH